jgi:hypothetical protein
MSSKNFSICKSLTGYDVEVFDMCLSCSNEDTKTSGKPSVVFQLLGMYKKNSMLLL